MGELDTYQRQITEIMELIAALENKLDDISDNLLRKVEVEGINLKLESFSLKIEEIDRKIAMFEHINLDADSLQKLLSLKPILVEIKDQQREILTKLPLPTQKIA